SSSSAWTPACRPTWCTASALCEWWSSRAPCATAALATTRLARPLLCRRRTTARRRRERPSASGSCW
ncbi:unnamed protein product, partial [Ectocarpus fasciculatus]